MRKIFSTIPFLLSIVCCLYFQATDYKEFIDYILILSGRGDIFRVYAETVICPPERYVLIQYLSVIGVGFGAGLSYLLWKYFDTVFLKFRALKTDFKIFEPATLPIEKRFLFLIVFLAMLRAVYYYFSFELQYDEAWTYNRFTSNGLVASLFAPHNNHTFYTLLSWLFNWLPIGAKAVIRLPVLIGGLISIPLFYAFLKDWKYLNSTACLLGTAYFAFSAPVVYYTMYGRGYIWGIVFTLLMMRALQRKDYASASVWGILNGLSVLSQIYAIVTVWSWAFFTQKEKAKITVAAFFNVLILGVLLFPSLLGGGAGILSDAAIGTQSTPQLGGYFVYVSTFLTTFSYGWLIVPMALCSFIFYIKKYAPTATVSCSLFPDSCSLFLALGFLAPFIFVTLQKVSIPERVWSFETIWVSLAVAVLFYNFNRVYEVFITHRSEKIYETLEVSQTSKHSSLITHHTEKNHSFRSLFGTDFIPHISYFIPHISYLIPHILIIFQSYLVHQTHFLNWSKKLDWQCRKACDEILADRKSHPDKEYVCYIDFYYIKPLLELTFKEEKATASLPMSQEMSKEYEPYDSTKVYNAVIWDVEHGTFPNPNFYQIRWKDEWMELHVHQRR